MTMREIREWAQKLENKGEDTEKAEDTGIGKNSAHRKQKHGNHMQKMVPVRKGIIPDKSCHRIKRISLQNILFLVL